MKKINLSPKIIKQKLISGLSCIIILAAMQACERVNSRPSVPEMKTELLAPSDTLPPKDSIPIGLQRLLKAYPDFLDSATTNSLIWKDGTEMIYDDGKGEKDFFTLLNKPDLQDQLESMSYPLGMDYPLPARKQDPGRVRYEPFFLKMYGNTKEEVQKKLVKIQWMPKTYNESLWVTTINGVNKKLEAISAELEKLPELHKYLENPGGTFNWRLISGTERMSMHSFGMTIDVNVKHSNYWRWAIKGGDDEGIREIEYKNRIPLELVELFEKHGFIWGGKWYHYDTMHFEYRPELIVQ